MKKLLRNSILTLISFLAVYGIASAIKIEGTSQEINELRGYTNQPQEESQEEPSFGGLDEVNAITSHCQTATTSPQFLTSTTATTSCYMSLHDVDDGYLNAMVTSTSTTPTLQYEFFITNEDNPAERNWFKIDSSFASWAAATSTDELVPYRAFKVSDINYKFLKLNYRVVNADANVYLEFVGEN